MPRRYQDAYTGDPLHQAVHGWDDGVGYIRPEALSPELPKPYFPPPPESTRSKTAKYVPRPPPSDDYDMRGPSEGSDYHTRPTRHSHHRRRSPSPLPAPRPHGRREVWDSPPRRRDARPRPASRHRRPPLTSSRTTPNPEPVPRSGSRRHHSSSPPPPRRREQRDGPKRPRERSPRDIHSDRPPLNRSKTTRDMSTLFSHPRLHQAAAAALQAGSMTAFDLRQAPGSWSGQKGARIATAALGAAALDALGKGANAAKEKEGGGESKAPVPSGAQAVGSALGGYLAESLARSGSKRGKASSKKSRH